MTYPEVPVREAIERLTIPFQLDNTVESNQPVLDRYRHVWTPDLRVLDADGTELYRWNGYLPPGEFVPQLIVAVAHARLRRKEYDRAKALYEEVLRRFPTALVAAEAQYYAGVSA
ncbi:MAG: tetratricopeptide repeat protein, partial [Candidatus Eremiobacteraeota bacterium]|nr:tetratricopeptide repeat protein [Candidatus Eremiobacteraeota bacterium]